MDLLTGATANKTLQLQQNQIQSAQRTSLATMAAQQGQLDQAAAGSGRRQRGRGLLTFLSAGSGGGQATLG